MENIDSARKKHTLVSSCLLEQKNPALARHPQASRVDTLVVIVVVIVLAVLVAVFVVVDSAAAGSLRWSDQCADSLSPRINAALSLVPCQVRSNE